ncbi:tripartite tricarboxylate transporter substrate-binding protein [Tautonia plasticadhaerens]|uniref:Tripartite tricarboxylate transporter family receptor n=1 Tax=Tautonia plasticadhaerens TaxID=2527974 RepID=A0A518H8D2_9BACT|nr:tripartite tricarboxylate transporter substrate-binding protein [Tautonia plasticadhaerens]QDV37108.1 Tripartite tricarboxylate transporter family receptor [Tautonia plasticadhaerens]
MIRSRSIRPPGRLLPLILASTAVVLAGCSGEERFPDRPIMLICPWSAGGGTDTVSRKVAAMLEQDLGVPVNVVNATGGSGVTGHTRGALAPPDGHSITMITVELNMLHWRGLTNIGPDDFRPVMLLNQDAAALFVPADSPWGSISDVRAAVAEAPRSLKASGTAQGGIWHVSLAGWLDAEGLRADDVLWIPINGAGPSLDALMSGGIDMVCCSLPEASSLMEAGRVRCLGVMAEARIPDFPDVPTFGEQGSDWSMGGWRGLGLPLGVPEDRAELLVSAVDRVIRSEDYLGFMEHTGFNVSPAPPGEFREIMEQFDRQMGDILMGEAFQSVRRTRYGPMIFPIVILALLGASLAVLLLRGSLRRDPGAPRLDRAGLARMGLVVLFVVSYMALAGQVGYLLSASTLLLGMLLALGVRWPVALATSAALVPATYQIFAVGLRVPLPWGWLGW